MLSLFMFTLPAMDIPAWRYTQKSPLHGRDKEIQSWILLGIRTLCRVLYGSPLFLGLAQSSALQSLGSLPTSFEADTTPTVGTQLFSIRRYHRHILSKLRYPTTQTHLLLLFHDYLSQRGSPQGVSPKVGIQCEKGGKKRV